MTICTSSNRHFCPAKVFVGLGMSIVLSHISVSKLWWSMERLTSVLTSFRGMTGILSVLVMLLSSRLLGTELTENQIDGIVWIATALIAGDTLRQIGGAKTIFDTVLPAALALVESLKKKADEHVKTK
jgi:hypothetical protein